MKWRGFRQDQRSVSEIYGTLLIISLAFVTALLLVGGGWVIVDQIQTEAEDSLAQDNVENIDQGINDLAGSSVNDTKTFEIPENTGEDYEADSDDGVFQINVTTDGDYWNRTKAKENGLTNGAGKEIVLGTIRHEAEDGTVTAFQGGGLWRQSPNSDTIFIESTPNLNYADGTLNLGIVNLTNAEAITEGSEITATRNSNTRSADNLQDFIQQFYTDRYNGAVTAPVQINITIESEYADGWAKHAEERMGIPSSNVHRNFNGNDDMVRIEIPKIGDGMPDDDSPTFDDEDILYTGSSDWAYEYQNDSVAYGALEDSPPGSQWAYKPTLNSSEFGGSIDNGEYEFAVYNESGRWLIYNNTNDAWETADGTVVSSSNLGGSANEVFNTTAESNAVNTAGDHEFWINPPSALSQAGAAPICIVTNDTDDANVRQHLDDPDGGCLENMVGIDDDLVDPIPQLAEFNVTVDRDGPATQDEYTEGDDFPLEVTVENEGMGSGERPLGVYLINESNFDDGKFTKSFLANSTKASNLALAAEGQPGDEKTLNYDIPIKKQWRMAAGNDDWVVFATTGTDTSVLNESFSGSDANTLDTFKVNPIPSDFQIEDEADIQVPAKSGEELKQGEAVTVEVTVNDTEQERDEPETQIVRLERDGQLLNQTQVTIGTESKYGSADWEETVEMIWYIDDDAPTDVELEASTYDMDSPQTKDVSIEQTEESAPAFDVGGLDILDGVTAGETVEVTAPIENVGSEAGEEIALLKDKDTGDTLAYEPVELDAGEQKAVTMEWNTQESDYNDGDPYNVEVVIDDNSSDGTIELEDPSSSTNFEIEITATNSPVEIGGGNTLDVDVTVENTGDSSGSQWVYLDAENFGGAESGYTYVEDLAPGDSVTKTLSWEPNPGNNGTADILAKTDDDQASEEVTVTLPAASAAEFEVSFKKDSDNSWTGDRYEATAGDTMTTEVTVENTGSERDWQYVYLTDLDGNTVATKNVTLDPGQSTDVTLEWATTSVDEGQGTLDAYSNDDSASANAAVTLNQPESNFQVDFQDDPYSVQAGNDRSVSVKVTNTGDDADTQVIYLEDPAGNLVDTVQVGELQPGDQQTVQLWWNTSVADGEQFDKGETLTVGSDDTTDTATIDVVEANVDRSDFKVSIEDADDPIVEGENLTVTAEITNDGDVSDEQDIVLENFGGGPVDATEVQLDAGETKEIELTWQTVVGTIDGLDSDTEEVTDDIVVQSEDDSDDESVTIEKKEATREPVDVMFAIDESGSMGMYNHVDSLFVIDGSIMQPDISIGYTTDGFSGDFHHQVVEAEKSWSGDLVLTSFNQEDGFASSGDVELRSGNGTLLQSTEFSEGQTKVILEDVSFEEGDTYTIGHTSGYYRYPYEERPSGEYFDVVSSAPDEDDIGDDPYERTYGFADFIVNENGDSGQDSYTVKNNEVAVFEDDPCNTECQATNYDDSEWFIAGETITTEDWDATSYDRISIKKAADDSDYCDTYGCYDPYGKRIKAAQAALSGLNDSKGDRAGALEFNTDANVYQDLSADLDQVEESLRISPGGGTDIAAAIETAEDELQGGENNPVMIVLTDGEDTNGEDPVDAANDVDEEIPIYTVGFGGADIDELQAIADGGSGEGEQFFASDTDELEGIFDDIIGEVTKPAVPNFQITDTTLSSDPVESGDKLTVTAEVTNNGEADGEQFVSLKADNTVVASQRVDLAQSETKSVDLTWDTTGVDPGDYTVAVQTLNDEATRTVEVDPSDTQSAEFEVEIQDKSDLPEEIDVGETVEVTATIKNTKDVEATQEIGLYIDNDTFSGASETVTLGPSGSSNDQTEVTLSWTPGADDGGERTLVVKSEQDSDDVGIVVNDGSNQPDFLVDIQESNPSVSAGEELTLNVDVTNDGDSTSTQTVYLFDAEDDSIIDFKDVELEGGETTTTQLTWQTKLGDDDTTLRAQTSADEETVDVNVTTQASEQADFDVTIDEGDEVTVTEGETALLDVTVENNGNASGTQGINLFDGDSLINTTELSLEPGEQETVTLGWQTEPGDGGTEKDLEVRSNQDDDDVTVVVEKDTANSDFQVDVYESDIPNEIAVGQQLEVTANISNQGAEQDEQNIVLEGSNPLDVEQNLDLEPGEAKNVTLTWTPDQEADGKVLAVQSKDDDESFELDITSSSTAYEVEIVDDPDYTSPREAGETVQVEVDVETNESTAATDELVWLEATADGETVAESYKQVDIGADGTKTVTLEWETSEQNVGEYELNVSTNDDMRSGNDLTLTPPTLFDVSVESVNTPITAGDKLEVEVAVENVGDAERSPALELNYTEDSFVADMTSMDEIAPGGTETVTLTWNTFPGIGDDDAKQTIRVQLANYPIFAEEEVQIDEAGSNLDRVSRPEQDNPLDIDLSEIEIGS
jgi:uncharacterized membrane protein